MTTLPANVTYGTVTGRFLVDGPDNSDVPGAGKVRFLPAPRRLQNLGSVPASVIELDPLTYDLDDDGYLVDAEGNKAVSLVATDNPEISPVDWTWGVTVSLEGQAVTKFDVAVPGGATIDLTAAVPTASSVGIMPATVVVSGGGGGGVNGDVWLHWEGTQAQYDALGVWDDDTLYAIFADDVGPPTTVPGPPQSVTALAGDQSATINWAAPSVGSPPTGYVVQRSTVSSGGFATIASVSSATLSYLSTPLTNGTTYYFQVIAANSVGSGAPSTTVSVVPVASAPTVPGTPTNTVAIAGPGSVTVNWLAPTSNGNSPITAYTVQRSTNATTGFATVQTVSGSTYSHLSSGLTNGTTYYFRVYATNAVGDGAFTAVVNAIPTTGATVPGAPTSVVATPGPAEVVVTWGVPTSDGGSALVAYVIERSTLPSSGFAIVGTQPMEAPRSFNSNPLTAGTTYYFRVTAQNGIGTGPASSIVNAVPTAGGSIPSDWATAVATGNLTTITGWYDTYTGHLSESFDPAGLWGPGQSAGVIVNSAWLTANAAPGKVVLSAGRWTITGLHCAWVNMHVANVTLSHCWIDRPSTLNAWGVDASPSSNGDVAVLGTIVDHCTLQGNFGSGVDGDYGDAIQYYNNVSHVADGFIIRYCEISGYRAGLYTVFGTTCEYNWVHDLYMYGASHNTSGSIRGENTRLYRNLLTDGNSSAVSLYADNNPHNNFEVNENILKTTNADYDVNYPMRPPNYWNLLYDHSVLGTGHVDGAVLPSAYGYRRECNGNRFIPALIGLGSGMEFLTSSRGNKLLDGTPVLFDEGGAPVANQPLFLKMRYNELGGGVLESQQTWEFTPSPNSTVLVFIGCVNGGHNTTQAPSVTAVGQYPQTSFAKILESPLAFMTGDENHGVGLFLYKAETGSTTSFEHIVVDPYPTTQTAYFTVWVYELTGMTGLSLAHSSVKGLAAVGFGNTLSTITSNALSGAATTGRVCMAFAAGAAVVAPASSTPYADVSGWTKTGVQSVTYSAGNPFCTGAVYWNKTFTGTTITIPGLGVGTYAAGVLLAEFA